MLDTAPVIYVVEQVPDFSEKILHYIQKPDIELVVSDLTWMECRVKPLTENKETLLADYDKFFSQSVIEIVELSRRVLERAAHIRSQYNIKTPDAIHLGAAIISKCDIFLTNDRRLERFKDIHITVKRI
ncbi:MAG: type II toxin-antitoxin system VapC family toxin [Gemmatimonadota bacterium]|nr:type II toxin-antitoxin system VapC family toxin [Gemmatimonadota bacterium]MDE2954604.1 type II toxin-antitoxin system VapC family toxin [Gemmatimonadota bacterium]